MTQKEIVDILMDIKKTSTDKSKQTSAVIVTKKGNNTMVIAHANVHTEGIDIEDEKYHARPAKYVYTEHAERAAIFAAARMGVSTKGADMYTSWFPCARCARGIVMAGIERLFYVDPPHDKGKTDFNFEESAEILTAAGVEMFQIEL